MSNNDFTQEFKILLLKKGISINEIASKVGISTSLMSHIIAGRRSGKKYRTKICEVLEIQISDLWAPEYCSKCGSEIKQ